MTVGSDIKAEFARLRTEMKAKVVELQKAIGRLWWEFAVLLGGQRP
jgi:hypothetical protein